MSCVEMACSRFDSLRSASSGSVGSTTGVLFSPVPASISSPISIYTESSRLLNKVYHTSLSISVRGEIIDALTSLKRKKMYVRGGTVQGRREAVCTMKNSRRGVYTMQQLVAWF